MQHINLTSEGNDGNMLGPGSLPKKKQSETNTEL